jgi:hypothetical protein
MHPESASPPIKKKGGECVDDVIYVKPITWPLAISHPGQSAVQTVSKPVQRQKHYAKQ